MKKLGYQGLDAYDLAYALAMKIFETTKNFPKSETYSLTDQIRRSSRSVCANIAEAYRKRRYPLHFISKMTDCDAECSETLVWLNFSLDCGYITNELFKTLSDQCESVGKLLGDMINNPDKYLGNN